MRLLTCPHAPTSGRALFLGVSGVRLAKGAVLALKPAGDLARGGFQRQVDSPLGFPPTPPLPPKLPPRGSKERLQVPEMGVGEAGFVRRGVHLNPDPGSDHCSGVYRLCDHGQVP